MYACKKAITDSNNISSTKSILGKNNNIKTVILFLLSLNTFLNKKIYTVSNKIWPETIFENNRKDKLINLKKYDNISIPPKKGISILGIPLTTNNEIKYVLKHLKPINTEPNQNTNEIIPVIFKWLLIVLENGNNPKILLIKIHKNIKLINNKNILYEYVI